MEIMVFLIVIIIAIIKQIAIKTINPTEVTFDVSWKSIRFTIKRNENFKTNRKKSKKRKEHYDMIPLK